MAGLVGLRHGGRVVGHSPATIGTLLAVTATGSEPQAPPARIGLISQLLRFGLVGGVAAIVDYGSYLLMLTFGVWVHLAKALAWFAGTLTAYLINRRWTFNGKGGAGEFSSVMAIYGTTFAVQVGLNAVMLAVLPDAWWRITLAFVIAQGTATVINFAVQRWIIFRDR